MEFQIGNVFIKLGFMKTQTAAKIFRAVIVAPVGAGHMSAINLQIANDGCPLDIDTVVYDEKNDYMTQKVKGWIADA